MNHLTLWISIICVIPTAFFWKRLRRMNSRLSHSLVSSFGPTDPPPSVAQREVIVRECITQNRRAFALVCASVVLGIILSTLVVGFFVVSKEFTFASMSSLAALVSDFSVAGSALKLYQASNAHLEKALAAIQPAKANQAR
jgi:hypothetical protein